MIIRQPPIRSTRVGTSSLELLIAFTLLASVIAFATPLAVKHSRLLAGQRNYRVALDELSNQVDRAALLSGAELREAVASIEPSDFAAARLPGVKIYGQLESIDAGQRLTLSLSWEDQPPGVPPLSLATWIAPRAERIQP
jgi:hypothetical protein